MRMRKALAFLLGLTLAFPTAAVQAYAAETAPAEADAPAEVQTDLPDAGSSPLRLYTRPLNAVTGTAEALPQTDDEELPESVDLRKRGLVPRVKNQGSFGTCWAYATLGSIETELLPEYPDIDLSERYLAYYSSSDEFGTGSDTLNLGGNIGDTLGLLTNWMGIVSEDKAPYLEEYSSDLNRKEIQQEAEFHVLGSHSVRFNVENPDHTPQIQFIKRALNAGHALYFSLNFNTAYALNNETSAYYFAPGMEYEMASHAMVIVGYDDNYPVENFLVPPPQPGAFLVKNSWDTNSGDLGYYWVSYCENTIDNAFYFDVEPAQLHDTLYSYDDFGCCGTASVNEEGDETVYFSNVYTAEEDSWLTDVMLNYVMPDDTVEITVYTDLADPAVPSSGQPHGITAGAAEGEGYQTVTLQEPVHLTAGEPFAVTVKLSGRQGSHIACERGFFDNVEEPAEDVPQDAADGSSNFMEGAHQSISLDYEKMMRTFGAGQSFFSADGENWTDIFDLAVNRGGNGSDYVTGNIGLKAMTVKENTVHFSSYAKKLAPGTEITLSCADGKDIYYAVDGGEYVRYTAPIPFSGEMTVSAYVDGAADQVYSQHYAEKRAALISLLLEYDCNGRYAIIEEDRLEATLQMYAENVLLVPVMEGTLSDGETTVGSYEEGLSCTVGNMPAEYDLTAEQEGLAPTNYKLLLRKEFTPVLTAGTWSEQSALRWFQFHEDGATGVQIDRVSGEKTPLSYEIADNRINLEVNGEIRSGWISNDEWNASITWDDGVSSEWTNISGTDSPMVYHTNPEIAEQAAAYYTVVNGEEPASVSAEIFMGDMVTVTLTAKDGSTFVYTVDAVSMVGNSETDGTVVNLLYPPKKGAYNGFPKGIWQGGSVYDPAEYLRAFEDDCYYTYTAFAGFNNAANYRLENEGTLLIAEVPDNWSGELHERIASVYMDDEQIVLTWDDFSVERLTKLSDESPADFHFYSTLDLMQMAEDYYKNERFELFRFEEHSSDCFETVTLTGYNIYANVDDYDGTFMHTLTLNRMTGTGTDENGDPVDLVNLTETPSELLPAGLWRSSSIFEFDVRGHFEFGADTTLGVYKDVETGEVMSVSYVMRGGMGVITRGDNSAVMTYDAETGMAIAEWIVDEGDYSYRMWEIFRRIGDGSVKDLKCYPAFRLTEMIAEDYSQKTGKMADVLLTALSDEGVLTAELYAYDPMNPESDYQLDATYYVNIYTGKGVDQNDAEVDLPHTGITSPVTAAAVSGAGILMLLGFWCMMRSGVLRKREDQ